MELEESSTGKQTYKHALKVTTIIAGSSVVNIGFAMIRTKAFAVLLGPAGVGFMSLFSSVSEMTQNLVSLGIQNSGVRQIAEAAGTGDVNKIARTATVLRRASVVLAILGAVLLYVAAEPVSKITFDDQRHAAGVGLLAAAVFFRIISAGQEALIQGMRRIPDLVRMNILAGLFSTVCAIPLIYWLGEDGIVPSLIAMAALAAATSWWFSRRVKLEKVSLPLAAMRSETAALLRLGVAFMVSGLLTIGAAYTIRIIVLQEAGLAAAGLYQAASTLGGLYTGIVLQAMGTDFYPRLTAVATDNAECNRLVNEQAQISLLIAGPGVIGTLTLTPLVLNIFYSAAFAEAADAVRWICLGMMLRVVAWPMGFILLAKSVQRTFLWTEIAATLVHVGLAWALAQRFGVGGAGAAFFGLYLWHSILIYFIVRRLSGFRWSAENLRIGSLTLSGAGIVFCGFAFLPFWYATSVGVIALLLSGLYALRTILTLYAPEWLPAPVRSWLLQTT